MGLGPRFAEFTGLFKVGTIDVEIPVSELESPSPPPFEKGSEISTIQYRLFYPCEPDSKKESITWLPHPQRRYANSYTKFLGAGNTLGYFVSYLPNILSFIEIPVRKNAALLNTNIPNKRWPVMIFSHGLGGTRNAYSFLAGSLASHGVIVVAPEHRDGSAPISFVGNVSPETDKKTQKKNKIIVNYLSLSHTPSPEVEAERNSQLKMRLWELGLIHESLLRVNKGESVTNLNAPCPLDNFKAMMDVEAPGKISFAGHSFGAATIAQFVKSTFYSTRAVQAPADYEPLFMPSSDSSIVSQITPLTPVILLDTWCLPLRAETMRWLWNQPFPCYGSQSIPDAAVLLAIESEAFYKWKDHLKTTKALLTPDPTSLSPTYIRKDGFRWPEPNFYYATKSAHLSQSDFGLLFPWLTKKILGCEEPERVMKLNVRAILQLLRNQNIQVSATSSADQELDVKIGATENDEMILANNNTIRGWNRISTSTDF